MMLTLRHGQVTVLDVETHPIGVHLLDPPIVSIGLHGLFPLPWWFLITRAGVMQVIDATMGYESVGAASVTAQAVSWPIEPDIPEYLRDLMAHCNLITHRGAYDLGCIVSTWPVLLPDVLSIVDRCGVYDTRIAAARHAGARDPEYAGLNAFHPAVRPESGPGWKDQFPDRGKFLNLPDLSAAHGGLRVEKGTWATGFATVEHLPPAHWPRPAVNYCITDLTATGWIQMRQCLNPDPDPEALVIRPGSWSEGVLPLEIVRMHLKQCQDVRAGNGIAWRDKP